MLRLDYIMWNKPTYEELERLPRIYETDHIPLEDKIIYQHYYIGASEWYTAEYDPNDRIFFGYTILNGDRQNSEWGYTSLDDLIGINIHGIEIERDKFWEPKPFKEVFK